MFNDVNKFAMDFHGTPADFEVGGEGEGEMVGGPSDPHISMNLFRKIDHMIFGGDIYIYMNISTKYCLVNIHHMIIFRNRHLLKKEKQKPNNVINEIIMCIYIYIYSKGKAQGLTVTTW